MRLLSLENALITQLLKLGNKEEPPRELSEFVIRHAKRPQQKIAEGFFIFKI